METYVGLRGFIKRQKVVKVSKPCGGPSLENELTNIEFPKKLSQLFKNVSTYLSIPAEQYLVLRIVYKAMSVNGLSKVNGLSQRRSKLLTCLSYNFLLILLIPQPILKFLINRCSCPILSLPKKNPKADT